MIRQILLNINEDLLCSIEKRAKDLKLDRTKFIRHAIESFINSKSTNIEKRLTNIEKEQITHNKTTKLAVKLMEQINEMKLKKEINEQYSCEELFIVFTRLNPEQLYSAHISVPSWVDCPDDKGKFGVDFDKLRACRNCGTINRCNMTPRYCDIYDLCAEKNKNIKFGDTSDGHCGGLEDIEIPKSFIQRIIEWKKLKERKKPTKRKLFSIEKEKQKEIIIENNIDIPLSKINSVGRKSLLPFKTMNIGDSIFISDQFMQEHFAKTTHAKDSARAYGKRHNKKFMTRRKENGYRIWRIK
jgi:hypothetical protein|tara:strand:+ start:112 stop:1008 length:897 start_codon:yes stop_codon:yes gene_type:complete